MQRSLLAILVLCVWGCSKKDPDDEDKKAPMSEQDQSIDNNVLDEEQELGGANNNG